MFVKEQKNKSNLENSKGKISIVKHVIEDVKTIMERDPSVKSKWEIFLCYSGFHSIVQYRIANYFYRKKLFLLARVISQISRFFTGIEIHPGATIGRRFFIDHGMGVVIGETTEIGDDVTIYQGVTLGGTGKDTGKRHPTIDHNVTIGSGAKVLGPILIGHNSKIGAGAVVVKPINPYSTAVGVPAQQIDNKIREEKVDLNHIEIPNIVLDEIKELNQRLEVLEKQNKVC